MFTLSHQGLYPLQQPEVAAKVVTPPLFVLVAIVAGTGRETLKFCLITRTGTQIAE